MNYESAAKIWNRALDRLTVPHAGSVQEVSYCVQKHLGIRTLLCLFIWQRRDYGVGKQALSMRGSSSLYNEAQSCEAWIRAG
jgi:hypothetical protein